MKIAIAGAGKLGLRITDILKGGNHSIMLIDKDEELIKRLSATLDVATVVGNAKEAGLLAEIGIKNFDYFITATDRDEKNIVIGATAKKLGVPKVIARIRDPEYDNQYELIKEVFGIDHIVNPERSIAEEINKYLVEKYSFHGGVLQAGKVSMLEINVDKMPEMVGRTATQAREELLSNGMALAAVSKNGKLTILGKDDGFAIEEDDLLFVVGEGELIGKEAAKIVDEERYTKIQRVMIAGGGKVGFYLARMLDEFGASVKMIEIDRQRCQYLATHLQNVLVLHGDAMDATLLSDENFSEMDAFVSITGFDEENLLLALMAKQAGIEDVIAKISRENFGTLITSMGVDIVLNPLDISASYIVRNIEEAAILSSQIIQGQAEFLRIVAERGMKACGKDIGALKLPRGVAIVAVQRGTSVVIPDDKTRIMDGDCLYILSLLTESFDLEKLLMVRQGLFS